MSDENASTVPHTFAIDPTGKPVALTDNQVAAAADNGFTPVAGNVARALAKANENDKYVDQNWGTAGKFAAGAASGLSAGLAPSIAARLGLVDPGHLEAAEQSGAFTAGDIAGMLAPTILTGGAAGAGEEGIGAIAKALRYGTPAGLIGEAGLGAERLVGRFAGESGLLGRIGTPALRMAARGATEGALINMSHEVSRNIIQDKPFTAQAILAAGEHGALFGGLTGGILGGAGAAAGAGFDIVGGRIAGGAARAGGEAENRAAIALKRMGASDADIAEMYSREGGLVKAVRGMHDVLENGSATFASDTPTIRMVSSDQAAKYAEVARDTLKQLTDEAPLVPRGGVLTPRLQDLANSFKGTLEHQAATSIIKDLNKNLQGLKTWEGWAATREQLADRVDLAPAGSLKGDIYKKTLQVFDDEFTGAMRKANPELADQFAAATQGARNAEEMVRWSSKKLAAEQGVKPIHLDNSDMATLGYSMLTGANPLVAGGIMAAKHIGAHVQSKMEPYMAEAAYRSAIGAEAGHATMNIGKKISDSVGKLVNGGRRVASNEDAKSFSRPKLSYTPESYEKAIELADSLTSAAHQAKVREVTDALAQAGHEELADEMAQTYGRAVAYINNARPKGTHTKEYKAGSLGKTAKAIGLNTQEMKFVRVLHAATQPVDAVLNGIERGDISRDAVNAVAYIMPDMMNRISQTFAMKVAEMKEQGKHMPADKIALAGCVLNYPVDSKLEKSYIDEVQKAHAANQAPPPAEEGPRPPNTDISAYQTPMQMSV